MVIWISLNGARKCVCLETQEQDSWHSFTTNTSGSSLNWWWFLLLIHDRWHYTISDPSWSVAATSRLGQVESMGSMISFRCCSVLFAIPTLSFGRQLARFFDLLCHVLMLYRRHLCFFFRNILLPSSKGWQVLSGLESGELIWQFQWDSWVMTRPMIWLFMLFHP